jgi:hypothetical protein
VDVGLILKLVTVAIETFHDERKDRFKNKRIKLEREYYDELKLPYGERSQLALDNIMLELEILARNVIDEHGKQK